MGVCINTEYTQFIFDSKNAYLSYSTTDSEDIYYSQNVDKSRNVFDSYIVRNADSIYENVNCANNYNVFYAQFSRNCIDSWFIYDCVNCSNCILSYNLRNKQYCILNVQYKKEEFENKKDITTDSFKEFQNENHFNELVENKAIHKYAEIFSVQNSTGDRIDNLSNCKYCFDTYDSENVSYSNRVGCQRLYGYMGFLKW